METRLHNTDSNDDLLVSWKDIACYLKCSIRKAQRLEQQGLPIHRIAGTKSVWAFKPVINRWLISKSECVTTETVSATVYDENSPEEVTPTDTKSTGPAGAGSQLKSALSKICAFRAVPLSAIAILGGLTTAAIVTSEYATAIALFGATVACVWMFYPSLPDTAWTRAAVGLLVVAGMSYAVSATTLPDVVESTINMDSLRPAVAYPFAAGLRFIPIPFLICIYLVAVRLPGGMRFTRHRWLRTTYWMLGVLSLLAVALATLTNSGAFRIWHAGLPIRSTLLIGNLFIWGVNSALLVSGYHFFNTADIGGYRAFLLRCSVGYIVIALAASIISRHWHDIDKHFLDVQQAQAYRSANANAISELQNWLQVHRDNSGSDLVRLARNAEFLNALRSENFYRRDFDEPFQVSRKAVIFGYRKPDNAMDGKPSFVLIRFPVELSGVLRFEPVEPETMAPTTAKASLNSK